ncbi:DUF7019 family protein [Streptomyces sp. NPDC098789]|uniref:DUF7019 family protein n=1 Tax=Streptomyces sp. NPDC098789 TaxID=3366098 RepID=UPI003820E105
MRYYMYVSESKVDMLFQQIPRKLLPQLATEAKVDLKFLSLAVQKEASPEPSMYERLNVVEGYLDREYSIGWMTEPTTWFRGELGLQIAGYEDVTGPVFMTGRQAHTVVALIGSAHHLLGHNTPTEHIPGSYSMLPPLFQLLREARENWHIAPPDSRTRVLDGPWNEQQALADVLDFSGGLRSPGVKCEFLARRLLHGTHIAENGVLDIVIGTPLYVAMAEDESA